MASIRSSSILIHKSYNEESKKVII
jgi:hypothetical protein